MIDAFGFEIGKRRAAEPLCIFRHVGSLEIINATGRRAAELYEDYRERQRANALKPLQPRESRRY